MPGTDGGPAVPSRRGRLVAGAGRVLCGLGQHAHEAAWAEPGDPDPCLVTRTCRRCGHQRETFRQHRDTVRRSTDDPCRSWDVCVTCGHEAPVSTCNYHDFRLSELPDGVNLRYLDIRSGPCDFYEVCIACRSARGPNTQHDWSRGSQCRRCAEWVEVDED